METDGRGMRCTKSGAVMPIHGPRKETKTPWTLEQDFMAMLNHWVKNKRPHKFGMHYPDLSCCYPELRATLKDKVAFREAVISLDENRIGQLRELREKFSKAHARLMGQRLSGVSEQIGKLQEEIREAEK